MIQAAGIASIIAGLLWTTGTLFNLFVAGSIEPTTTAGATLALVTHVVMIFGIGGIYAGQAQRIGLSGILGLVFGIVGTALIVGINTIAFARTVGAVEVLQPPMAVGAIGVASLLAGVVLLGIGTFQARVYSRWAALPFVLTPLLFALRFVNEVLAAAPILAASVGFVWLGWNVFTRHGDAAEGSANR